MNLVLVFNMKSKADRRLRQVGYLFFLYRQFLFHQIRLHRQASGHLRVTVANVIHRLQAKEACDFVGV